MVETGEETCSHRSDITRIETSLWKARQGTIHVEANEEAVSYGHDAARIETSLRETRQGSIIIEISEEVVSRIRRTITKIGR